MAFIWSSSCDSSLRAPYIVNAWPLLAGGFENRLSTMNKDTSTLPSHVSTFLSTINTTTTPGDDLDLFFHCWTRPHCLACLSPSNPYPCSWCATSQTCVPNTIYAYPFGILSPLESADICPLAWRERWELRARPFSCRCSSMTFVSVVVAVLATLLGLLVILSSIKVGRWAGRKWRGREDGWWRAQNWAPRWIWGSVKDADTGAQPSGMPRGTRQDDETTPLIP